MFEAKIYISLKESVLDPQGLAVLNALKEISFTNVHNVRIGKFIQIWLEARDKEEAKYHVEEICKKLLVNEVIETYSYDIL